MKKWLIIAGLVFVVWFMVVVTLYFTKDDNPTEKQLKILKKDIKILRVVAEHRELRWKIQEYEKQLKPKKTAIVPVPSNANVKITEGVVPSPPPYSMSSKK